MSILRNRFIIVFLAASAVAVLSIVAWKFGFQAGIEAAMQDSFYAHKLHAEQELSALNNLRASKSDAIRSNLEAGLDLSVAMLVSEDRAVLMTDKTRSDVTGTLMKIKYYRKLNPYPGADERHQAFIQGLLKDVPEK